MPDKVSVTFESDDRQTTSRARAENAWFSLVSRLLQGSVEFEFTDLKSGKSEKVELGYEVEDDVSMTRYLLLMTLAGRMLGEKEKASLEDWEAENLDGRDISSTDWDGWEKVIGQRPPSKFRRNVGIEP